MKKPTRTSITNSKVAKENKDAKTRRGISAALSRLEEVSSWAAR